MRSLSIANKIFRDLLAADETQMTIFQAIGLASGETATDLKSCWELLRTKNPVFVAVSRKWPLPNGFILLRKHDPIIREEAHHLLRQALANKNCAVVLKLRGISHEWLLETKGFIEEAQLELVHLFSCCQPITGAVSDDGLVNHISP